MNHRGPFTTPQVAAIVGLPTRKVIQFEERGLVFPSEQPAAGRGSKRLWSYEDVIRCALVKYLGDGLSSDYLRAVMARCSNRNIGSGVEAYIWLPVDLKRKKGGAIIWPPGSYMPGIMNTIDKSWFDKEEDYELATSQLRERHAVHIFVDFKLLHDWVQGRIERLPV